MPLAQPFLFLDVKIRTKLTMYQALDTLHRLKVFATPKSEEWLLNRIQCGDIEGVQIGNRHHIFADSLEEYILKINRGGVESSMSYQKLAA